MKKIKLWLDPEKQKNHKRYTLETYREEFLNDSGIDVTSLEFCPQKLCAMHYADVLDEVKFMKYVIENNSDYEVLSQ